MNTPSLLTGKRAVIVEDEGITVMQLKKMLFRAGMQVVGSANNAEAGIAVVLKEHPDLVLMDINMPGNLNGLEAAEAILARCSACIVMVTAYDDAKYRQRAAELKVCGYVVKPVVAVTLLPQLEQAFGEWTRGDL